MSLLPTFQERGGSIFRRDCWESGGGLFHEESSLYIKNELKSEIYNDQKSS